MDTNIFNLTIAVSYSDLEDLYDTKHETWLAAKEAKDEVTMRRLSAEIDHLMDLFENHPVNCPPSFTGWGRY